MMTCNHYCAFNAHLSGSRLTAGGRQCLYARVFFYTVWAATAGCGQRTATCCVSRSYASVPRLLSSEMGGDCRIESTRCLRPVLVRIAGIPSPQPATLCYSSNPVITAESLSAGTSSTVPFAYLE